MKDFFAFRLMITAGLIKVHYPLGAIGLIALTVIPWFLVPKAEAAPSLIPPMSWDHGLLFLLFANIGWRIFCEQMIVLFAIHESLSRGSNTKG